MVLLQRNLYFSKDPKGVQGGGGGGSEHPILPMDPHINTETVIQIETRVRICGQTDKTYKHAHLQAGRLKETFMRMFRQTDV